MDETVVPESGKHCQKGIGDNVKVHLVRKRPAASRHCPRIHYYMFHGIASRTGQGEFSDSPAAFLTNDVRAPLKIYRNGRWAPEIFSPRVNLIVSEKVRAELQVFESIDFLKVKIVRLIDYPLPDGDVTAVRDVPVRIDPLDMRNIFRTRANVPSFRRQIGNRYELLMARVADIRSQYPDVRTRKVRVGTPAQEGEVVEFDLSNQILKDYPMVCGGPWIFGHRAFSLLRPHFDWRFYLHTQLDL